MENGVEDKERVIEIRDEDSDEGEINNLNHSEALNKVEYDINGIVNSFYAEKFAQFDNLDMLEKGYAREYIREELLNPFVPRLLPRSNSLSSHLSSSLSTSAFTLISLTLSSLLVLSLTSSLSLESTSLLSFTKV